MSATVSPTRKRGSSSVALGRIDTGRAATVAALVDVLRDPDAEARAGAAWALGMYGDRARAAVPALIRALQHRDSSGYGLDAIAHAAIALGRIGPAARPALPALLESLRHIYRRQHAAWALAKIAPDSKEVIEALARLAREGTLRDDTRFYAVFALGEMGPGRSAAVAPLIDALDDRREEVRVAAAVALGKLRGTARPALPALVALLTEPKRPCRRTFPEPDFVRERGTEWRLGLFKAGSFMPGREEQGGLQQAVATALKHIDPEAARRAGIH